MLLHQLVAFGRLHIFAHHLAHQLDEADLWGPAELVLCFARIAQQCLDFGGTCASWNRWSMRAVLNSELRRLMP